MAEVRRATVTGAAQWIAKGYFDHIQHAWLGFVRHKRALGLRYDTESRQLRRFAEFTCASGCADLQLDRALVEAWNAKRSHEAPATWRGRVNLVRQLALYVSRLGVPA